MYFCIFQTEESEEPDIEDTPIGIVTMIRERSASPVHFSPVSTAIVVEDEFIMRDIATFADAYVLLFGLVRVTSRLPKEACWHLHFHTKGSNGVG